MKKLLLLAMCAAGCLLAPAYASEAERATEARLANYRAAVDTLLKLDLTTVSLRELSTKYKATEKEFGLLSPDDREAAKLPRKCDLDCYRAVYYQFGDVDAIGAVEKSWEALLARKDLSKTDLKQQKEKDQDLIAFPLTLIERAFSKCGKTMPTFGFLRRYNELAAALDEKIKAFDAPTATPASVAASSSASASSAGASVTRVAPARPSVKEFNAEFKRHYDHMQALVDANPFNASDSYENMKAKHQKLLNELRAYRDWTSDFNVRAAAVGLSITDPDVLVTLIGRYYNVIRSR